MSMFISINIVHLLRQTNPQNEKKNEIPIKWGKKKNGNDVCLFA